jgi:branched-chain amino acid transport system ATP-binding protein
VNVLLDVNDLTVTYHGVVGISGFSLQMRAGEMLALLGPNGAGKSSVLRGITGSAQTRGHVLFQDRDITRRPAYQRARRGIIQVPQGGRVFAELDVTENLLLGGYRASRRQRAARLAEVLELFPQLAEHRGRRADSLSGGQQQLLAIGRALMARPQLMLLDEPSLGLAPAMVEEVFAQIARLKTVGVAVIVVDQNALQAMDVADSVCVLSRGATAYYGSVEDARANLELVAAHLGLSRTQKSGPT